MKIGFIGAGRMGRPMVDRLVAAGYDVTVLTRSDAARTSAAGLNCADTVGETVRDADLVISVVLADAQVRSVFLGADSALAAMKPGSVLVQHTTCDPGTVELLSTAGAERGVRVLDAAVSGGPGDISKGSLTLWVGGDEGLLSEVRPVLASYADPITHVGNLGNGQRVKLLNNALFVAQVGLAVDAVRIAESIGVDERTVLAAAQQGSGASRAGAIVAAIGVPNLAGVLAELMIKDVDVVHEIADRAGIDLGVLGQVLSSDAVVQTVLQGGSPARREDVPAPSTGVMKS